jgi:hypothetical protein
MQVLNIPVEYPATSAINSGDECQIDIVYL